MTMYDVMYEAITEKYENGEITFEQANELNELAYDKYVSEGKLGDFGKAAVGKLKNLRAEHQEKRQDKQYQKNLAEHLSSSPADPSRGERLYEFYVKVGNTQKQYTFADARTVLRNALKKGLDATMYRVDKRTGKSEIVPPTKA